MTLGRIWSGHFRKVNSADVVVSAGGCEPGGQLLAGSYLLDRRTWDVIWYGTALLTDNCKRISFLDGRDGLVCSILGLTLPTWQEVVGREYHPWDGDHLVIDTAGRTVEQSIEAIREQLPER